MKLPKNIIKKYGISKKAWAVFRGERSSKTKRGITKMARKKHFKFHSKMKSGLVYDIVGGAAYGFAREWVSDKLKPITSKVPLGVYADNVVMGALSYFIAKGKIPLLNKVPMMRQIGKAGLIIESALLGVDIKNNGLNLTSSSSATTSSTW